MRRWVLRASFALAALFVTYSLVCAEDKCFTVDDGVAWLEKQGTSLSRIEHGKNTTVFYYYIVGNNAVAASIFKDGCIIGVTGVRGTLTDFWNAAEIEAAKARHGAREG